MFNGRAIGHALAGLGILCLLGGLAFIVNQCACTPAQLAQAQKAAELAKDIHDCKVLNGANKAGRDLCIVGVAIKHAGESLDEPTDAGGD
jgi:hypothetical protein